MSNEAIDALRARIAELEATAQLQARVEQLSARIASGPGYGSPAAMPTKQPKQAIGGGGGDWARVREDFFRRGDYQPL